MAPQPRRRRFRTVVAATGLAAALLAAGCAQEAGRDPGPAIDSAGLDPATTEVEYRFGDSSVPPEYHRSYSITVADGEARMVVDSYGDELHDVTETVDEATWAELIDNLDELGVRDAGYADGCEGGTSRDLYVTDDDHPADDPAISVAVLVCGGSGGDDAEAVDDAIAPVLGLFDAETLLSTG